MYEPYPICTQHKIFKLLKVHCNLTLLDTKLRKVEDKCIIVVLQGNREFKFYVIFLFLSRNFCIIQVPLVMSTWQKWIEYQMNYVHWNISYLQVAQEELKMNWNAFRILGRLKRLLFSNTRSKNLHVSLKSH